jgi:hypothetical protein
MALCTHSSDQGWVRRIKGTRTMAVTPKGRHVLGEAFGIREW